MGQSSCVTLKSQEERGAFLLSRETDFEHTGLLSSCVLLRIPL